MSKHKDARDQHLPEGVSRIDKAVGGPVRPGHVWVYKISLRVGKERFQKRLPSSTSIRDINELIQIKRGTMTGTPARLAKGTFEADVENDYLPLVSHLESYAGRASDIRRWAKIFEGRNRNEITPQEIGKWLSAWRRGEGTSWTAWNKGRKRSREVPGRPLAESTLNHRISALSNFYTKLNGPRGYNPCDELDRYTEPETPVNFMEWSWVKKVLEQLESHDNMYCVIARCLAWTGARPKQINKMHRVDLAHVLEDRPFVILRSGKGGRTNPVPVPKAGVQAFKDLLVWADKGEFKFADERPKRTSAFTTHNLRWWVQKTVKAAGYEKKFTTYWLRHSLATQMIETGSSTREVQNQLTHTSLTLIERYGKVSAARLSTSMDRIV
jgi:site-specific recombinase XerD